MCKLKHRNTHTKMINPGCMIPLKDPKSLTTELKKTEISKVSDENLWLDEDVWIKDPEKKGSNPEKKSVRWM